jgi:ribose 5-phosphate isomerase B
VDFSDFVYPAALAVANGECERAILVDGAGYPSAAIASMLFGVYPCVCFDSVCARLAREHSNTNVLCLGGKLLGDEVAKDIVKTWLTTPFLGGKYQRRIEKVQKIEERHLRSPELAPIKSLTVWDIKEAIQNKKPLVIGSETIITPSVLEWVNEIR